MKTNTNLICDFGFFLKQTIINNYTSQQKKIVLIASKAFDFLKTSYTEIYKFFYPQQNEDSDLFINDLMLKIDTNDASGFQEFFNNLNSTSQQKIASQIAEQLLSERIEELQESIPFRDKYEFILENLKIVYPFLNTYFAKSKVSGQGVGKTVISAKGVKHLVNRLKQKNSFHNTNVTVCQDFEELAKEFKKVLKNSSSKELKKHCFLLRHRYQIKPKDFTGHISPIYIEKKDDKLEIYITDSGGGERHWTRNIIQLFKQEMQTNFPKVKFKIYPYKGKKRQMDFTNCPIFSIRDIVHFTQDPEMKKWMKNKSQPSKDGIVHEVRYLHPKMMSTCQSFSYFDHYLQATQTEDTFIYSKSKPEGKTLEQIVDKHAYEFEIEKNGTKTLKKQNFKIAHLFLKYERLIISDAIAKGK